MKSKILRYAQNDKQTLSTSSGSLTREPFILFHDTAEAFAGILCYFSQLSAGFFYTHFGEKAFFLIFSVIY